MPRRENLPSYRLHKQSGQAVVTLPDALGNRKDVLLGVYDSPASHEAYRRTIAEWVTRGGRKGLPPVAQTDLSIAEMLVAFLAHAEQHYRHLDGTSTSELSVYKYALKPLRELYAQTSANDFGSLALMAVRERMIELGWCRKLINQQIGRIKRVFKWATSRELIEGKNLPKLLAVAGLQAGRSAAKDTEKVRPVPPEVVEKTLPLLPAQIVAMIRLQQITGMRPGEVAAMRTCDITLSGDVWEYRPAQHKTQHHDHERVIILGPRAQAILKPWLRPVLSEYLFQPREAMAELRRQRRERRKTRVQPSQQNRAKKHPYKQPGIRYHPTSYARAISVACRKANIPHWHPHQLRHLAATEMKKNADLDTVRTILGHQTLSVTDHYAEMDRTKAMELARRLG
jgi:integrase